MKTLIIVTLITTMLPVHVFAESLGRISAGLNRPATLVMPSVLPAPIVVQQKAACDSSTAAGREDAGRHGTAGWFIGGVGAGVALGLIGTGVIVGGSALTSPQPREVPAGVEESCYRDGYRSRSKNKNIVSSLLGGLTGTAAWLVIFLANN